MWHVSKCIQRASAWRVVARLGLVGAISAAGALCAAQALEAGGQVRLQWTEQRADKGAALETELRATGHGITGVATLQQSRWESHNVDGRAWVNELYASHDAGAWQFSAGKKVVSWDVGYGFRPNDLVQQEERRTLVSSTAEGRPLVMAEHFTADTAWALVAVNPTGAAQALGALEPALAARAYRRDGAVDWHGFARLGARNGASVGAALAWVATDAMELHGSVRYQSRSDSTQADAAQALLGGMWTHSSQVSLLVEAWWDGTAEPGLSSPRTPALGLSQNLRRDSVFTRLSWQSGAWSPALDVLYTPADQGHAWTASLAWQGDRVQVQGGVRSYGGPAGALLAQAPTGNVAYITTTWAF